MKRLIGLAVLVGIATGAIVFGLLPAHGAHQSERVIRYKDLAAGPFIPPVPRIPHECRGPGVRVAFTGDSPFNSTLDGYWIRLRNVSHRTCLLDTRPEVRIRKGAPVTVRVQDNTADWNSFPRGFPGGIPFGVPPGREATANIIGFHLCGPPSDNAQVAVNIGVFGATTRFPVGACRRSGVTLYIGPWIPPTHSSLAHWPLTIALELPATVEEAGHLRYRVRLTNTGSKTFHFPSRFCPKFGDGFRGSLQWHGLKCRPAGALPPGGSAVFQQQQNLTFLGGDVMTGPSPGRYPFVWRLDDGTKTGLRGHGTFTITPSAKPRSASNE